MGGLKVNILLSIFGIGLKGSILNIFSYFIIALFFRHRVLKFIDLYLSRQACKLSFIGVTDAVVLGGGYLSGEDERILQSIRMAVKFVSFSLSVLKFVGVVLGDGGG